MATSDSQLISLDPESIKKEIVHEEESTVLDEETTAQADAAINKLLAIDPSQTDQKEHGITAIENMGSELQKMASRRSNMLKQTISTLAKSGEDGGPVAQSLVDLQMKVEELDPHNFEFSANFLRRLLTLIPGIGSPLARYFAQYQSAESVIANIIASLEKGKDQLKRDNITLKDDQAHFAQLAEHLRKTIAYAQLIDQRLTDKIENEMVSDDPRTVFLKEEVLFPLRQRIVDLQQQLAVSQQGELTIEVVRRNNKELIRGVNRALNVTVNALQIAVTLALALANQKIVLQKIEAINTTTNDLIAKTAANLKQQGAAIHKQAASAQLDVEVLKQAFNDINSALEDISQYRQNALPKMANTIIEMDQLSDKADESIKKFRKAEAIEDDFGLEIIDLEK